MPKCFFEKNRYITKSILPTVFRAHPLNLEKTLTTKLPRSRILELASKTFLEQPKVKNLSKNRCLKNLEKTLKILVVIWS